MDKCRICGVAFNVGVQEGAEFCPRCGNAYYDSTPDVQTLITAMSDRVKELEDRSK